ncbi:MAG TPA: protein-glutamate O-methyltransferase CheR [Spirochaetota bacterium]|nr:protein-glutamate O-methyltransferase CheR [Spirochaetota bacterium]HPI88589.1 protein-glutamate O-methyltransferase CheR [Spirochaetota bacterium]HPR48230.1 protein-glutamate O-methyltransferase CheR [Spirochaetota bacterium]
MEINIKRLTDEEFKKFAKLIYEESGIFLKETKITLLSNRLRKRLGPLNLKEFSDYYDYLQRLTGEQKKKEYELLLDVVSTNETYFFRNERHFEAFSQYCIPELVKTKKNKKLRIWSAACSTGEEPYTLAICILENKNLLNGWDIQILGTDIAPSVLDFARIGEYSGRRIEKVPPEFLEKYFIPKKDDTGVFLVKDEMKNLTNFYYLNFFKDKFPVDLDVIFCRNVMIYFDKIYQRRLVADFYKSILDTGYLFIGHSETLHSISEDFEYKKVLESPVYIPKPRK